LLSNKNLFLAITIIVNKIKAIKTQRLRKDSKDAEEYATRGPFTSIFGEPVARLLDQALIVGNMEQTNLFWQNQQTYPTRQPKQHLRNWKRWALLLRQEK